MKVAARLRKRAIEKLTLHYFAKQKPIKPPQRPNSPDPSGTTSPIKMADMKYKDGYRCYVCKKFYTNSTGLKNHLYSVHDVKIGKGFYSCESCDPPYKTTDLCKWKLHVNSARHKESSGQTDKTNNHEDPVGPLPTTSSAVSNHGSVKPTMSVSGDDQSSSTVNDNESEGNVSESELCSKDIEEFKKGSAYKCDKCTYEGASGKLLRQHYYSAHHQRIPGKYSKYYKCTLCSPPFYTMQKFHYGKHIDGPKHKRNAKMKQNNVDATQTQFNNVEKASEAPYSKKVPPPKEEVGSSTVISFSNGEYHCILCSFSTTGSKRVMISHLWSKHAIKEGDQNAYTFYLCDTCDPNFRSITDRDIKKHQQSKKHLEFLSVGQSTQADQEPNDGGNQDADDNDEDLSTGGQSDVEGAGSDRARTNDTDSHPDSGKTDTLHTIIVNKDASMECGPCEKQFIEMPAVSIYFIFHLFCICCSINLFYPLIVVVSCALWVLERAWG